MEIKAALLREANSWFQVENLQLPAPRADEISVVEAEAELRPFAQS